MILNVLLPGRILKFAETMRIDDVEILQEYIRASAAVRSKKYKSRCCTCGELRESPRVGV